jgi:hypothetical protein
MSCFHKKSEEVGESPHIHSIIVYIAAEISATEIFGIVDKSMLPKIANLVCRMMNQCILREIHASRMRYIMACNMSHLRGVTQYVVGISHAT